MRSTGLRNWIALLGGVVCLGVNAQEKITLAGLKEDFRLLRTALEEAHPGLYRYQSEADMQRIFEDFERGLTSDLTEQEFYSQLLPLIAAIGCGHTKLHPERFERYNYYYNTDALFPLKLFFDNEKAYALGTYGPEMPFAAGTRILAIDDEAMEQIIARIVPTLFADGSNKTLKYYEMGRYFSGLYGNLGLKNSANPGSFRVAYLENGVEREVLLSPVTLAEIQASSGEHAPYQPFSFTVDNEQQATLTIASFWPEGRAYNYKRFLKASFRSLEERGIGNLIIDLRNNEGGRDAYGALLLSYLADQPFHYYDSLVATTNKKFSFRKHAKLPKAYFLTRLLLAKSGNGSYHWKHHRNLALQKPQKTSFSGNVYVLINGGSFSVTSEFAAVAHSLHRAVFIGEETGGGYYGNNSGTFAIVSLPHSGLNLGIPLLAYYTSVTGYPLPDRGLIPDVEVKPTLEGVIEGRDEVLEYALRKTK